MGGGDEATAATRCSTLHCWLTGLARARPTSAPSEPTDEARMAALYGPERNVQSHARV
jgi:hypothetical protein